MFPPSKGFRLLLAITGSEVILYSPKLYTGTNGFMKKRESSKRAYDLFML